MHDESQHPEDEVLSAWIDGEASPDEHARIEAHVGTCAICAAAVRELKEIVHAAKTLADVEPERDLWADIGARVEGQPAMLRSSPWLSLAIGLAAGICVTLAFGALRSTGDRMSGERFMLLLHEPTELLAEASPEEVREVIARYAAWAGELHEQGQLELGEKLVDEEGRWLMNDEGGPRVEPRSEGGGVGGFFVIRARNYEQAVAISRTCPHLAEGGSIELRRIQDT